MRFMRACLVVVLVGTVACGSRAKSSPSNTPATTAVVQPADNTPVFKIEVVDGKAGGPSIEGTLRNLATKEPLQGATVVVNGANLQGERETVADEQGRFIFESIPDGAYTLNVYWTDQTTQTKLDVKSGKLVKIALDWDLPASGEVVQINKEPVIYTSATEALTHGAVDQATKLGEQDLAKSSSAKLHGMLAIAKYGMAIDAFHATLRASSRDPKVKELRVSVARLVDDLDKVQAHLAEAAKDPQFALELCVACMTADGGMGLPPGALDIERDRDGKELPEGDARRRPTFRFDHGDLAWGRAMVSFQQSLANVSLAYDWDWFESLLLSGREPADGTRLTVKLVEPARIAKARELVLAGLKFSDDSRAEFLAETDDDREWVPSPKHKNYASPLSVDAKLYKTWQDVIGDVRALVDSKAGISLPAVWKLLDEKSGAPAGYIDLGAMFKTPKDIVIEIGAIDRIEVEKNPKTASKMTAAVIKDLVGNGYKTNMKASKLTDRLLQLRKDLEKSGGEDFEQKLKYVLWLN